MPKRVLLIFLGLLLFLSPLAMGGCGNSGEILVHEPTSAPATVTPVPDA